MPGVRKNRAVLHLLHMFHANHMEIAGDGDENIPECGGIFHLHHAETVHTGLECAERIDFCHNNIRTETVCAHGAAFAAAPVS